MTTHVTDIETQDWDIFVMASSVSEDGEVHTFYTADAWARWYLSLPSRDVVIAHNGGRFDFLALIDAVWAIDSATPWTATLAGSGLITLRAKGHAECRDSYRLFPMSLNTWTGVKDELGLPCVCKWKGTVGIDGILMAGISLVDACHCECHVVEAEKGHHVGCYRSIRVDMPPHMRDRCMEYCVQDCRALLATYQRDVERAQMEGFDVRDSHGRIRRTLGSVAWHTARNRYGADDGRSLVMDPMRGWEYHLSGTRWNAWNEHDGSRLGYYGGRCEVYRVRSAHGHRYDINSAYPWALTLDVPVGRPVFLTAQAATRALAAQRPGIYKARVSVPRESLIGPLAHRMKNRLVWPVGDFEGHWTREDLLVTLPLCGGKILEVKAAIIYPEEKPLFRDYMEHVFARRRIAQENGANDKAWDTWCKLAGNSLSGKLAQGPEQETLKISTGEDGKIKRGMRWLGGNAHVIVHRRVADTARPFQAAVLTARVRAVQLARLLAAGAGAVYGDTDSAYLEIELTEGTGSALGLWKYEGAYFDWQCRAPKVYRYWVEGKDGRKEHVKIKGVPDSVWATYDAYTNGIPVSSTRGVQGIRSALTREGKAFVRRNLTRASRANAVIAGSRFIGDDGDTRPLIIDGETLSWAGTGMDPAEVL